VLAELLRKVARGGLRSTAALACELDVSEGLLAQMIHDLARLGCLQPVGDGCGSRCDACPAAGGCLVDGPSGLWALTEKGRRVVRRHTPQIALVQFLDRLQLLGENQPGAERAQRYQSKQAQVAYKDPIRPTHEEQKGE